MTLLLDANIILEILLRQPNAAVASALLESDEQTPQAILQLTQNPNPNP